MEAVVSTESDACAAPLTTNDAPASDWKVAGDPLVRFCKSRTLCKGLSADVPGAHPQKLLDAKNRPRGLVTVMLLRMRNSSQARWARLKVTPGKHARKRQKH